MADIPITHPLAGGVRVLPLPTLERRVSTDIQRVARRLGRDCARLRPTIAGKGVEEISNERADQAVSRQRYLASGIDDWPERARHEQRRGQGGRRIARDLWPGRGAAAALGGAADEGNRGRA